MDYELQAAATRLKTGIAPSNTAVLSDITVGIDYLTGFWEKHYLSEYIPSGGNRIQFLTGGKGSGKTHLIEYFLSGAKNYKTVSFSARDIWLHDFSEIYFEVLRQCDLEGCLSRCCEKIVAKLGFSTDEYTGSFMEYLTSIGENDPSTKREIRRQISKSFMHNPLIDNNFAIACVLLCGGQLGHPILEMPAKEALLGWLSGKKDVKLSTLRALGLSPVRIAKHNARHMLRSLVEIIKMADYRGLIIAVDELDILISRDSLQDIRYTKLKRQDSYESMRELIDEIDTLRNVFFLFAFDRSLLNDEDIGIKSYQALWFRILNEIQSNRFNRFSNMIDLDRLPVYDVETIMELSSRVASVLNSSGQRPAKPLDEEAVKGLLEKTGYGSSSLPRNIVLATVGCLESNEEVDYGF